MGDLESSLSQLLVIDSRYNTSEASQVLTRAGQLKQRSCRLFFKPFSFHGVCICILPQFLPSPREKAEARSWVECEVGFCSAEPAPRSGWLHAETARSSAASLVYYSGKTPNDASGTELI